MADSWDKWDIIVANWVTDHRMSASDAIERYSGTGPWLKAREMHKAGACERVVREYLSRAIVDAESGR